MDQCHLLSQGAVLTFLMLLPGLIGLVKDQYFNICTLKKVIISWYDHSWFDFA